MTSPRHLRLLLFCLATAGSAPAQVAGQRPADFTPTQRLFDAYRTRAVHLWADPVLGQIHARQLKPSAANVASAIELLAGHLPQDDKVELARILGDLYTQDNQSGHNAQIASRLQDLVRNGETPVATAALFAYSGLGGRVDTKRMMQRVGRRAPFERAAARALDAARHFPGHPIMTALAENLNATLATLVP